MALDKHFDPDAAERGCYERWIAAGCFDSIPQGGGGDYCIVLPPPNVTGTLHMGHAFQHTLMDALVRREKMRGKNVLWQAGTDHAGIATQIVVARDLEKRGIDASTLSREEFLRHAWQWKEHSGNVITSQMRRLGAACDWSRERFTMDEGLSAVVNKVFVRLYDEGLIYRGKRLVNWDPVMLTAVSDLEVVSEEEDGVMYHVRYPFLDDEKNGIVIATTRPETILVDGAVAVHPDDDRFRNLVGRRVIVPMTDPRRDIAIIADEVVDPKFGSGCVKITAAHDFNDYAVRERHPHIPMIVLLTPDAKMNENAPQKYRGLDRFEARRRIVNDLRDAGLLLKEEAHRYHLPRGDRSGAVVEPMLTDQWYVRADKLAPRALAAAAENRVRFVPPNWRKTYDNWLNNIQDWCISRQLMWGHQIPAWYDDNGDIYVAEDEQQARAKAGGKTLRRDDDVLDTWFSSALWPFSTLGWPDEKGEYFRRYFPTSVLVTGFDIIFFWVARMVMMSEHLTGKEPFGDVYITGLVRDSEGSKMSKSKGNIIDPLDVAAGISLDALLAKRVDDLMSPHRREMIEKQTKQHFPSGIPAYGTDALRMTFASLASYGRDIKFDLERCAGYRNFCNKLWNAARFVSAACEGGDIADDDSHYGIAERWIVSRLQRCARAVEEAFDIYRFDLAAAAVYHFLWDDYCAWYLEIAKGRLQSQPQATRRALAQVLEAALRLAHPIIPFITENLWQHIAPLAGNKNTGTIMLASYPQAQEDKIDKTAEAEMARFTAAANAVRKLRAELQIPPKARPVLYVGDNVALPLTDDLARLCGAGEIRQAATLPPQMPKAAAEADGDTFYLALDWQRSEEDNNRRNKKLQETEAEMAKLEATLANDEFVNRAPAQVVEHKRRRLAALRAARDELQNR
ncbi:MAG: valine--tRNA ligase [Gammaproteobacteria bacterium]